MTFSEKLRTENEDLFQAILKHPFVKGIGKGKVPKEALAHYIKADYEYLNAFIRVYGVAIAKTDSRKDMEFYNEQIRFVLNSEVHPHQNFCEEIGVRYEELQGYPLPPTADHYVKHMMHHAHNGGTGEILAALLPCPWTYLEIGKHLSKRARPTDTFYDWIEFYASGEVEHVTTQLCQKLDTYAATASPAEKQKMKDAFRKSCQLEWAFWEMAFTCETWPAGKEVPAL